jgi:hypothetical protein
MADLMIDIIRDHILPGLDVSLKVTAIEAPIDITYPTTQRVKFCDNKWLRLYNKVNVVIDEVDTEIDVVETGVAEWQYDEDGYVNFTINSADEIFDLLTAATLNRPISFNGTLSNTKLEWAKYSNDERDKLPFIWLVSPTSTTGTQQVDGGVKNSAWKLWFVHWSNWSKLNDDRQEEAVRPLFALYSEFMKTIERLTYVFDGYDNVTTRDFPKFGTETPNGIDKTIFDSTLSAIETDVTVKIFARYCELC